MNGMGASAGEASAGEENLFDSQRSPQRVLLTALLRVALIAGIPAVIPGVIASIRDGLPIVAIADILAYLLLLPIYFGRHRSHTIAASLFCMVLLALGTVLLVYVGPVSAALLVLVMPPVLAGLLLGRRAYSVIWLLTVLLPGIITIALYQGSLRWTVSMPVWLTLVASFLFVTVALSLSIRFLVLRLLEALRHERELNESLRISNREKETLLQEVHHRVRNNLQVVNSLLSLQKSTARGEESRLALDLMHGRISAMANSYNYLEIDGSGFMVDLGSVVEAIARDIQHSRGTSVQILRDSTPLRFSLDRVTIIALAITEILWNCPGCEGVSLLRHDGGGDLRIEFNLPADPMAAEAFCAPAAAEAFSSPVAREILAALAEQVGGHCDFPVVTFPF